METELEGIWSYQVLGVYGWEPSGILVLNGGRVAGGNNFHFVKGQYTLTGDAIELRLTVQFTSAPPMLFGARRRRFSVNIDARLQASAEILGKAVLVGRATESLPVRCQRLSSLD